MAMSWWDKTEQIGRCRGICLHLILEAGIYVCVARGNDQIPGW